MRARPLVARARRQPSAEDVARLVNEWNNVNPVGTPVRYWTGLRQGEGKAATTRSEASVMCGSAVVWLEGVSGCVALTHVQVIR